MHQQLAEEVNEPQAAVDAEAQLRVLEQQLIERNQELERAVERFNRNRPTGSHDSDIEYDDSSESFSSGSYSEESEASSSDDDEVISDEAKSMKRKAPEEVETSQAKKTKTDSETITNNETVGTDGTESMKRKSPTEEADTSQSKKAKTVTETKKRKTPSGDVTQEAVPKRYKGKGKAKVKDVDMPELMTNFKSPEFGNIYTCLGWIFNPLRRRRQEMTQADIIQSARAIYGELRELMPNAPEEYGRHLELMDQLGSRVPHMEAIRLAQRMYQITIEVRGLGLPQIFYTHRGEHIRVHIEDGVWNVCSDSELCGSEGSSEGGSEGGSEDGSSRGEVVSKWEKG